MVNKETNQLTPIGTPVMADLIPIYDINDTAELKSTTIQKILDTGYVGALTSDAQTQLNRKNETNSPLYTEQIYVDGKLSNTHVIGSQALVTYNGNQYAGIINSSDQIVLLKRTVGTKVWSSNVLTTKTISDPSDSHNTLSLAIDKTGFLHIWYDHHSTALKYFKMPTSESIAGTPGANISMTGLNESSVTYPTAFLDASNDLYFAYRSGVSGDGDMYIKKYDTGTTTWAGIPGGGTDGIVVLGSTLSPDENFYWSYPELDATNNILHFGGVWRETTDESTNHDVSYFKYDVALQQFKKADDSVFSMPITLATSDIVDAVAKSSDLQSGVGDSICSLASDGNPVLVYRKNDSESNQQYFSCKWSGAAWGTPKQLTSGKGDWENNTGVNILRNSSGHLFVLLGGYVNSDGLTIIETRDDFSTWVFYKLAKSMGQVREIRSIDRTLWKASNILNIIFQHGNDRDYTYTRRPIQLLHWEPNKGKTDVYDQIQSIWSYDDVDMRSTKGQFVYLCEDGIVGGSRKIKLYNANGYLELGNGSGIAGRFAPQTKGLVSDSSAVSETRILASAASDSGSLPLYVIDVRRDNDTAITARPILGVRNNGTYAFQVLADGTTDYQNEGLDNFILRFTNALTPSQITTNQHNYSPTGMSSSSWLRLSTDASRNITGISAPSKQKFLLISNVGSFNIVLKNESVSSTDVNRFALNADITIAPFQGVIIVYDVTQARWTAFGSTATGGLNNIVEDLSPQLGADLDFNTFKATGVPDPTANDEIVNKQYFDNNTETVAGTKAAYKVIARDATNTGNEWTLLTNNHLSGSAGITYANLQNVSATDRILGRDSSGAGVIEEITPAALRTMINVADGANNYSHPNHSGDVTSSGDGAQTIANNAVTNAKANDMAQDSIKGRISSGTGDPEDLTAAQVRTMIQVPKVITAYKSADEDVSSATTGTTMQNDNHLAIAVEASSSYMVLLSFRCTEVGGAGGDIKLGWSYPTGTTIRWERFIEGGTDAKIESDVMSITSITTADRFVRLWANVLVSTTPGTLTFQWAQNTSNTNATRVYAGANMVAVKTL